MLMGWQLAATSPCFPVPFLLSLGFEALHLLQPQTSQACAGNGIGCQCFVMRPGEHCDTAGPGPAGALGGHRGCPLSGERFHRRLQLPWSPAALQHSVSGTGMENRVTNASPQGLPRLDWAHQDSAFLNLQQPSPTGLEGLEAVSSVQKVLQWLEVYVPSDPGALAKENEDSENKTDKGQSREILEEDMPSDTYEDRSGSQGVSEDFSDQELFQWDQDENKAAKGKAISKLQRISPPLAASTHTKDEPAISSRHQRGMASVTTPTSPSQAASTPTWEVAPVPRVQRRAHLLPSHPPADTSPSLTATHSSVPQQRPSLFRRALRAVCRVFLGTRRPREQQSPAPSARPLPREGCSQHQQRPLRK